MEWKFVGAWVVMVAGMMPLAVAAQPSSQPSRAITIRSFNSFGVTEDDLRPARELAKAVLRDAGVEITWVDCWFRDREPVDASPRCRQPVNRNELVLRLMASDPGARTRFVALGFSLVRAARDPAFLMSVFVDRVQSVARSAGIDQRRLLGLAIAHEIGHLLLDSNNHATAGLMRADWSRTDLRRNAASDWRFLEAEAATMRKAMAARESGR